ncbi:hypothetical protein GCM10027564_20550 [Luteimonas notoginsengisoli]
MALAWQLAAASENKPAAGSKTERRSDDSEPALLPVNRGDQRAFRKRLASHACQKPPDSVPHGAPLPPKRQYAAHLTHVKQSASGSSTSCFPADIEAPHVEPEHR